jgi:UDP-galactopyranose mutase
MAPENMTFIGRCGLYAYLDMHQAVSSALEISKRFLKS